MLTSPTDRHPIVAAPAKVFDPLRLAASLALLSRIDRATAKQIVLVTKLIPHTAILKAFVRQWVIRLQP